MDTKDLVLGLGLLFVMSLVGFLIASSGPVDEKSEQTVFNQNFTVNAEEEIVTASFDQRSLDLMLEDSQDARFYLDIDRDGSFEREIDNSGNGTAEKTTELVELENRTYRVYLETFDDSGTNDDAYLRLYRAVRQ